MGAKPRFDSYGRLAGAELMPLAELGRPRIDVVITLSGIFRDLLPLQIKLLAEAAFLAASADEPLEQNFIRKHALAYQAEHGGDLETASLRVFGNAEGAYGSNVNHLVDNSRWDDEDELAETYSRRKGFAYGRSGRPVQQTAAAAQRAGRRGAGLPEPRFGGAGRDHGRHLLRHAGRHQPRDPARQGQGRPRWRRSTSATRPRGDGTVRTLSEQVALETRTRMLNPKWYEGMLEARLRRRAPDRGARHQHDGLVGHHRPGAALGLPAADRDLRARPGDARAPGQAEPDRLGQGGQPAAGSLGPPVLATRCRHARRAASAPARSWKTGSKASHEGATA